MAIFNLWRRTTFFACLLMAVGIVEYFVVVQLHSSLQAGEREELLLAGGRPLTLLEREAERQEETLVQAAEWQGRQRELSAGARGGGEVAGENLDQADVRLARELHDLRVDRLKNFQRRTGSFLADQQQRNFEVRSNSQLPAVDLQQQQQQQQQQQHQQRRGVGGYNDRLAEILNLSRVVDEILSHEGKGDRALRQYFEESEGDRLKEKLDRLYDIYAAKDRRDSTRDRDGGEDYTEMKVDYDSEEEEEEEDYKRVFDPEDFVVSIGTDGRLNVSRKPLPPEMLVENTTFPARNMTTREKAGLNILLSIRYHVSCQVIKFLSLIFSGLSCTHK